MHKRPVQKSQDDAEEMVCVKFEQLRQELNRREEELLKEVDHLCTGRRQRLSQNVQDIESMLAQLSSCLDAGERVVSSQPSHVLHSKDVIFTQAQRLLDSRSSNVTSNACQPFQLAVREDELEQLLETLSTALSLQETCQPCAGE